MITVTHNDHFTMRVEAGCPRPVAKKLEFFGFADEIVTDIKHRGYCTDEQGFSPLLRGAVYRDTDGRFYATYREGGYWNAGEWVDEFSTDDFNLAASPGFADLIAAAAEADRHADMSASRDRESATPNAVPVG